MTKRDHQAPKERNGVRELRLTARPLLIESGVAEAAVGIWGTYFLVGYRSRLFVVTAEHLVRRNHSGEVVIFPSSKIPQRLPIYAGVAVWPEGSNAPYDVIAYPAHHAELNEATAASTQILSLDTLLRFDWEQSAFVDAFFLAGYPKEINEVDYEKGVVHQRQVVLEGHYLGASDLSSAWHKIKVNNPLAIGHFAGLSGSPVFSVHQRVASDFRFHFCGVAVAGSADSGIIHFVDARAVQLVLDTAIEHYALFGAHGLHGPLVDR